MKNNKKGAEITLNTIIIAAIAVIVLIVLVGIFTGKIRGFGLELDVAEKGAKQNVCSEQKGYCAGAGETCVTGTVDTPSPKGAWSDCPGKCCIKSQ